MTAQITPFPDDPGTQARRVDVFTAPPPRLYRVTEAQPSGAAVVYALGADRTYIRQLGEVHIPSDIAAAIRTRTSHE